ncbi:MAG: sulfite exporter TauE/SafE family protein [Solirubrobacterales bacterium]
MSFDFLYHPIEQLDESITGLFEGAPLLVALGLAFLLGLRHASDPDHLIAVTSLVASDDADARSAARLGAWWGAGHAATLLAIGLPLIVFKTSLPSWLENGAEKTVGVVILALALRVLWKWKRGDYRATAHEHQSVKTEHRHLHRESDHGHVPARSPKQAFSIGVLHGLAGTGAIVVLLIAALPSRLEAVAAMAVFAPMSIISMAACTAAFAWVLTRPVIEPVYRGLVIPLLGSFGILFGLWYVGLT